MLKRINPHWGLFLAVLMAVTFGSQAVVAHAATPKADQVKAAYIIDAQSGQAVYAQNPDEKLPIASLSKLMTLYLVEQAIKKGQIKWSDQVPLSKGVRKMATSATLSVMPMPAKEQFTVKELFAATLVGSSNSGAIALGEYVGGDNAKFVKLMNQQAKRWSLDATFVSASGLDNTDLSSYGYDLPGTDEKAQNLVSARAITTIARHLINEFPDVLKVANQTSVKIHKYRVPTSVQILKGQKYYDPDVPVDGLKTGYTNQAGGCLVATYRQGGRRMIATTLGAEWKFSADHNLRLKLKQTERFHTVLPKTINYQVPGTQTKVRLVTDDQRDLWENQRQPFLRSEQPVWPLHRTQPNYLAAGTAVLRVRLSDPLSGTSHTVTYRTPQAVTLLGPLHWATTTPKQVEAPLAGAFALAF
ncbi:D-alanyl-D-alanine carboxypeptidase family protein [Lactiplantibacillus modestisalitolerans]|uniref:D-alanyl-D-alanine carboxypeptidase family protein n=1 Tax=Lactiplantibacillus modestisalitolerans TaxID=1457219 RepID=A0ABV5WUV3_9LACO|nr:D-alanyl-D-alanine carboxypeptidase family protein [Lactiplantibacillus modestisalitolerans]